MYYVQLKTLFINSLRDVFSSGYLNQSFADLYITMEYPIEKTNYPSVWVDWEPEGDLAASGVDGAMIDPTSHYAPDLYGNGLPYYSWVFEGYVTFTCAALSSLQRDSLLDEVVRVISFGNISPITAQFRSTIENDDTIGVTPQWDKLGQRGFSVGPSPWGGAEQVYEGTLALQATGNYNAQPTLAPERITQIVATWTEDVGSQTTTQTFTVPPPEVPPTT
jgi:hypothetical protein